MERAGLRPGRITTPRQTSSSCTARTACERPQAGMEASFALFPVLRRDGRQRRRAPPTTSPRRCSLAGWTVFQLTDGEIMAFLFLAGRRGQRGPPPSCSAALYPLYPDQRTRLLADPAASAGDGSRPLRHDLSQARCSRTSTSATPGSAAPDPGGDRALVRWSAPTATSRCSPTDDYDLGREAAELAQILRLRHRPSLLPSANLARSA